VNFGAHVLVAARVVPGAPTGALVGAAGPDLVRMAGLRTAADGSPDVLTGVTIHHRTDAVFHDLAWFRDENRAAVAALRERGVRRGPARGAGHVLVELLLDGALLAEGPEPFARVWAALGEPTDDAVGLVAGEHDDRWRDLLDQLTTRLEPQRYADPTYAADRTVGTLARRPRLALTDAELTALHDVAGLIGEPIADAAAGVLHEVSRVVRTLRDLT
jgi:hypothetical protein